MLPTVISLFAIFMDRFIGVFTIDRHLIKKLEQIGDNEHLKIKIELAEAKKKKAALVKNWGYDLACITIALILASFGIWYGDTQSFSVFNNYKTPDLVLIWEMSFILGLFILCLASIFKHYDGEITNRERFSLSGMLKWISTNRYTLLCNGIGFTSLILCLGVLTKTLNF